MTLLAPTALWLLALAAPIAALYWRRERPRRLVVSNFLLWREAPGRMRESAGWRKLRHPFSLLLQLVFLFLVACALARPTWRIPHQPVVLVLDVSASMGATDAGPSRLRMAAEALQKRARAAGGPFTLITTGEPPGVPLPNSSSRQRLERALRDAQPSHRQHSPRPALEMARSLAANTGACVVFATDGVWDEPWDEAICEGVEVVRVGSDSAQNSGVVVLAARRLPGGEGGLQILAGVAASGDANRSALVRLRANGRLVDARELPLSGRGSEAAFFELAVRERGALELEAEIAAADDVLAADNSARLQVPEAREQRVLLISPPRPTLEKALASISGIEAARVWPPESLDFGDPEALAIFHRSAPPEGFQARAILLIQPAGEGFFGRRMGGAREVQPDLLALRGPGSEFLEPSALPSFEALDYVPVSGAQVFWAWGDHPLVFGELDGTPPWLAMTFDPSAEPLAQTAAHPVLLAAFLERLAGGQKEVARAQGPSLRLTSLASALPASPPPAPSPASTTWPPLWSLLLGLALIWAAGEAWSYHRRLTA